MSTSCRFHSLDELFVKLPSQAWLAVMADEDDGRLVVMEVEDTQDGVGRPQIWAEFLEILDFFTNYDSDASAVVIWRAQESIVQEVIFAEVLT